MASWQYRNDDFKFVDFTAKDTAALEKAWAAGTSSTPVTIHGQKYAMNLEKFTQTNVKTEKERMIRRRGPDGASTWARAPIWEWESSKGSFTAYDQGTSDIIERAFLKDELCLHVALPTSAHTTVQFTVHFGHMHQKNDDTDAVRRVRRVMKQVEPKPAGTAAAAAPAAAAATPSPKKAASATKRVREESAEEDAAAAPPKPATIATAAAAPAAAAAARAAVTLKDWTMDRSVLCLVHLTDQDTARGPAEAAKIAAFDMDDTLVYPKTGQVFAKARGDWQWLDPAVPGKLKQLRADGFQLVIFTNQSGIGNKGWDEAKATDIKGKILDLGVAAGVPLSAMIATKEDDLRKPGSGMWEMFLKLRGTGGRSVDMQASFYAGDAAGRQILTMAGRKKDFSCSDRKFAYNVGLPFFTPEEYFRAPGPKAAKVPFAWDGLGPDDLAALPTTYDPALQASFTASHQEMVLFVAFPGAGKSTFYQRMLQPKGYLHINRDTLKTPDKCLAAAETFLSQKKSCVVDNTNPSAEDRARYIKLAQKHHVPVRAFVFRPDAKLANHMNIVRARLGIAPRVSSIAYNTYKGRFEAPNAAKEGLAAVVDVPLVVDFAGLPKEAKQYFFELS